MNRRGFLALLGAAAVGCASRSPSIPAPFDAIADQLRGATGDLNVFLGGGEFLVARDQRVTFGLADSEGMRLDGGEARAWVATGAPVGRSSPAVSASVGRSSSATRASVTGPYPITYRTYTEPEPTARGFYVASLPIAAPGVVEFLVEHDGRWGTAAAQALARPKAPAPGAHAIPVPTPTRDAARGVVHVCTRAPSCGMHDERLDHALGAARPVVFTIASPKFCTSRTCGPVVDEVLAVRARNPDALYVHAEPFADADARIPSPTFDAWRLQSEPWTFVIDARARIAARFEGPVSAEEIERVLRGL